MLDLVRGGLDAALALGQERLRDGGGVPLREVRLLPPLAPPSVRDFVTFEEHVEGIVKSAPFQMKKAAQVQAANAVLP